MPPRRQYLFEAAARTGRLDAGNPGSKASSRGLHSVTQLSERRENWQNRP